MDEKDEKKLSESIGDLVQLMRALKSEGYLPTKYHRWKFLFYEFFSGIVRGIGFLVGTTIVFAIMIWILSQLVSIPMVGDWLLGLTQYIEGHKIVN